MADRRPVVFVSSTVFDFRDLRSALKFWLDELGYDTQLSEYNDFAKSLDVDSFSACLRGAAAADYFVLLLGTRTGGFYNAADRVSITRQEYRTAYDSFKATGKPRIVAFVRSDVWHLREDRRGLQALIARDEGLQRELSPDDQERVVNHASRIVNDAAAMFEFIDEVKRKDEMSAAVETGTGFPPANWVHIFEGFEDIIAVLRRDIRLASIRRASLEANLLAELVEMAGALTMKKGPYGAPTPMRHYVAALRPRLGSAIDALVTATGKELAGVAAFATLAGACCADMTTTAIDEAIRSGEFLEWMPDVNAFASTPLHRAIVRVRDEVARLRRHEGAKSQEHQRVYEMWTTGWRTRATAHQEVPAHLLMPACAMHDRHENILALAAAIHAAIQGKPEALRHLSLWSSTPFGAKREPLHGGLAKRVRLSLWLDEHAEQIAKLPEAVETGDPPTDLPDLS